MATLTMRLILAFFCIFTKAVNGQCPIECVCFFGHVTCKDLTSFPVAFPSNTVMIYLTHLDIDEIPGGVFNTLPSLKTVEIRSSRIHRIRPGAFEMLHNLETINFDDVKIEIIEPFAFMNITELGTLSFYKSTVTFIEPFAFSHFFAFDAIDIYESNITLLSQYSFYNIDEIFKFTLNGNRIKTLEPYSISGLTNTYELTVNSNYIEDVGCGTVELLAEDAFVTNLYSNKFGCSCGMLWIQFSEVLAEYLSLNWCENVNGSEIRLSDVNKFSINCTNVTESTKCELRRQSLSPGFVPTRQVFVEDTFTNDDSSIDEKVHYLSTSHSEMEVATETILPTLYMPISGASTVSDNSQKSFSQIQGHPTTEQAKYPSITDKTNLSRSENDTVFTVSASDTNPINKRLTDEQTTLPDIVAHTKLTHRYFTDEIKSNKVEKEAVASANGIFLTMHGLTGDGKIPVTYTPITEYNEREISDTNYTSKANRTNNVFVSSNITTSIYTFSNTKPKATLDSEADREINTSTSSTTTPSSVPIDTPDSEADRDSNTSISSTKTSLFVPMDTPFFEADRDINTSISSTTTPSFVPMETPDSEADRDSNTSISSTKTPSFVPMETPDSEADRDSNTSISSTKTPSFVPMDTPFFEADRDINTSISSTKSPSFVPIDTPDSEASREINTSSTALNSELGVRNTEHLTTINSLNEAELTTKGLDISTKIDTAKTKDITRNLLPDTAKATVMARPGNNTKVQTKTGFVLKVVGVAENGGNTATYTNIKHNGSNGQHSFIPQKAYPNENVDILITADSGFNANLEDKNRQTYFENSSHRTPMMQSDSTIVKDNIDMVTKTTTTNSRKDSTDKENETITEKPSSADVLHSLKSSTTESVHPVNKVGTEETSKLLISRHLEGEHVSGNTKHETYNENVNYTNDFNTDEIFVSDDPSLKIKEHDSQFGQIDEIETQNNIHDKRMDFTELDTENKVTTSSKSPLVHKTDGFKSANMSAPLNHASGLIEIEGFKVLLLYFIFLMLSNCV
ncbi:uncharacterized protein LOC128238384 [Mya arenaria]|uniref:uncharacterized protein LOC128238384 n=1 Tax=Mya arenaria TaxID=6604 RepID=UPI0022E6C1E0|nr:uncharacterized protein LOC128238384 [Mya arenaria]